MSGDEIAAAWRRNGLVQRSRGTLLHFTVEAFLNFDSIQGPYSPELSFPRKLPGSFFIVSKISVQKKIGNVLKT